MNVFIDTNILISYLDDTRKNHKQSVKLLYELYANNIKMIFSEDILTNVVYNAKRENKKAVEFFRKVNNDTKHFAIVNFGKNTINQACDFYLLEGKFNQKGDFEDTLQYFCALDNNCKKIYTNDKSNFPKQKIPLYGSDDIAFYIPKHKKE